MDCPALTDKVLVVSMSDEVVVLEGEYSHSVEGQNSAENGRPSAAAKGRSSSCRNSCWVSGCRVCNRDLDRTRV